MLVGFIGLGRMGQALVPRLLESGVEVLVWNRTPDRAAPLVEAGAKQATRLGDLVERCEIILSILLDDRAVSEVYDGKDGLLSRDCAGRVFVDMSTIRPGTIRDLAVKAESRGAMLVDAPVSGSVGPAREGKLLILAGAIPEAMERVRPVLSLLARRIEHLGPPGSGSLMKIVLQLPLAVYWSALAEALSMGVAAGLSPQRMLDLIADSPAAIAVLRSKIPVILGEDGAVGFSIGAARKDLSVMNATASLIEVSTPLAAGALAAYANAAQAGWAEQDLARLVTFAFERANTNCGRKDDVPSA
jgi:3-hydroxyisobutyrate dehydrogenase